METLVSRIRLPDGGEYVCGVGYVSAVRGWTQEEMDLLFDELCKKQRGLPWPTLVCTPEEIATRFPPLGGAVTRREEHAD